MKDSKKIIILIIIVLCGALLRLYMIGESSLWLDEAFSVSAASKPVPEIISRSEIDPHPPLYLLILHFWMGAFGNSEAAIRTLSALFGIATIPLIYLFTSKYYGKSTGLICALLVAFSIFHIHHSRDARAYSLLAFSSLCSFFFFLNIERGWWFKAGYVLSTLLMLNTHNYSVFYVIAQNLLMAIKIIRKRASVWRWIGLQSATLLLYIPTAFLVTRQMGSLFYIWVPKPSLNSIAELIDTYSGGLALALLFGSILIYGALKLAKRPSHTMLEDSDITLLAWLFVPIIAALLASVLFRPIFLVRATIASSFPIFIILARGIDKMRWAKYPVIALFLVLSILAYHPVVDSEDWKGAVSYIESAALPGDTVILDAGYAMDPYLYYAKRQDLQVISVEYLNNVTGMDKIWLVVSHSADKGKAMKGWLEAIYNLEEYRNLAGIEIYVYKYKYVWQ